MTTKYGKFSSQEADTITFDIAAIIQRAGIILTDEQLDSLEPELLPYVHDLVQTAAHNAWLTCHSAGITDVAGPSPTPYPLD